ncbi:MAG: methylated-DNA--[protein]-cysteine S-methyltransferase [Acidobacteriota bacterium]|nr:methylated-DNA--[protein]-cysteine S-methyltransferase [Acidobacteriota bacterium]
MRTPAPEAACWATFKDPIGQAFAVACNGELNRLLHFSSRAQALAWWRRELPTALENRDAPPFPELRRQLDEYYRGARTRFDLPLAPHGTYFQESVWRALTEIPFGSTLTYGELAERIGRAGAARAVGRANGDNPIGVVIPCHRVIGSDGSLTGYAGGIDRKRYLLELEGALRPAPRLFD